MTCSGIDSATSTVNDSANESVMHSAILSVIQLDSVSSEISSAPSLVTALVNHLVKPSVILSDNALLAISTVPGWVIVWETASAKRLKEMPLDSM